MIPKPSEAELRELERLEKDATPGPWRAMRDGNQYLNTTYMPTAECVAASRLDGVRRPWNPHAYVAHGFSAKEFEVARFVDADADLIAAARNALPGLLAHVRRLEIALHDVSVTMGLTNRGLQERADSLREALNRAELRELQALAELDERTAELAALRATPAAAVREALVEVCGATRESVKNCDGYAHECACETIQPALARADKALAEPATTAGPDGTTTHTVGPYGPITDRSESQ